MRSDLRASLATILLAASSACSSSSNGDCAPTVVDRSFTAAAAPSVACANVSPHFGVPDCRGLCGDPAANQCSIDGDYVAAWQAANPHGPDAGASNCPPLPDGGTTVAVTCEETHLDGTDGPRCIRGTGRRPEGLAPFRAGGAAALGAYFAEQAYLEAASVHAFRRLERELAAHGAPAVLIDAARAARRDEIRHARAASRLAHRIGARVPRARVPRGDARSLVELALENAIEGVVGETYGALALAWAARHAQDAAVRDALGTIADDEVRHAELAHRIDAWARPRLRDDERRRVDEARAGALEALERDVAREPHPRLRAIAGAPSRDVAARLVRGLRSLAAAA